MFIKVHSDVWVTDNNWIPCEFYINSENIVYVQKNTKGDTEIGLSTGGYIQVHEPVDDIMRVIGYFRVATIDEK